MVVGICVGETSLTEVTFISDKMPRVGEYVTIEYDGKKVLGMIENLIRGNDALNVDINDFKAIQKISKIGVEDNYIRGKVKILGDVNDDLKLPRTPTLPGTEIHLADKDVLEEASNIINHYMNMIDEKEYDEELLEEAAAFKNTYKQANRIKCATIGWRGVLELLEKEGKHE